MINDFVMDVPEFFEKLNSVPFINEVISKRKCPTINKENDAPEHFIVGHGIVLQLRHYI